MPQITGPSLANPGSDVVVTGKALCASATVTVKTGAGANVPFVFDCDDGNVTITFTMPACGDPPHLVLVTITDANGADSHTVANNCP